MSAPLSYLHLTNRVLELQGFKFAERDFGTLLVARYKNTDVQFVHGMHKRHHPDKDPWAVLFEGCVEFLEARDKVKGPP